LGGSSDTSVSKTFTMAPEAVGASMELKLYNLEGVTSSNAVFKISVQNSPLIVDMSLVGVPQYLQDAGVTESDDDNHRVSLRVDVIDGGYLVTMEMSRRWWKFHGYKLPISVSVNTGKSLDEESYGLDDLKISLDCARRLDDEIEAASFASAGEDSEEGFYCRAVDFPCGEAEDMVHVCHYSSRLGYQTFCIPEADSEVLRFYNNDYCGPCVGGFGGINLH